MGRMGRIETRATARIVRCPSPAARVSSSGRSAHPAILSLLLLLRLLLLLWWWWWWFQSFRSFRFVLFLFSLFFLLSSSLVSGRAPG